MGELQPRDAVKFISYLFSLGKSPYISEPVSCLKLRSKSVLLGILWIENFFKWLVQWLAHAYLMSFLNLGNLFTYIYRTESEQGAVYDWMAQYLITPLWENLG